MLVKLSTFVKLDERGLIRTHWKTLCDKYLFQSEISRVKTWHVMYFRENNYGGSKRAQNWVCKCYQFFHDLNSVLHTVTNIYPKAGILLKRYECFM